MTMTESAPRPAVPASTKRKLLALTARIAAGQDAARERALILRDLHDAGKSFTEIGALCGITKQAAASAVNRRHFDKPPVGDSDTNGADA